MKSKFLSLGIESTAHTFGASIVSSDGKILADVKDVYKPATGSGIHPREASRHHSNVAHVVIRDALEKGNIKSSEIEIISYSAGPGLGPCLRVGATVARTLALHLKRPLVPVNHAIGHIELGCLTTGSLDPVTLLVSGGHTMITAYNAGKWRAFGETLDITAGQLLDQLGRHAGYSSPAGAVIEKLASGSSRYLKLPYSVKGNDVSLSGILTASKRLLDQGEGIRDVCFSVQETAFAMLTEVTERAVAFLEKPEILLTGGVAANTRLTEMLKSMSEERRVTFRVIPRNYAGDCGAQIAWVGALAFRSGVQVPVGSSWVKQSWRFDGVEVPWRIVN